MNAEEVARQIAGELAPEFGASLRDNTERAIQGTLPLADTPTRGLREAADVAVIAHFIWTAAPIAVAALKSTPHDGSAVRSALERVTRPAMLSAEVTKKIIDKIIAKLGVLKE
jgi:hypothetical protein